jgi:hypothetical protein
MAGKKWTEAELAYLNNQYGKQDAEDIARAMGRTKSSVQTKAAELGLKDERVLWSDEDVVFLRENYLTLGADEVARRLGKTVGAVHGKIRKVGGGRPSIGPRVEWTEAEDEFLRENYQGLTIDELEQHLGRTKGAIYARAQLLDVVRYVDPFPFFETWTEQSAYVVGLFAADGWVSKRGPESIRIAFDVKEPDILYALQEAIGSGRMGRKASGMYSYYIQSTKVYEWLCNLFGRDVCRKSKTLQWPNVPTEFMRHFIRGAMDGDGALFKTRDNLWSISYASGSEGFVYGMEKAIFDHTGIVMNTGLNKIHVWHTRCTGIKAVCLADWLYRDATIALERKAWIAREMMQTRGTAHKGSITDKMREMFPHIISGYRLL